MNINQPNSDIEVVSHARRVFQGGSSELWCPVWDDDLKVGQSIRANIACECAAVSASRLVFHTRDQASGKDAKKLLRRY